MRVALLTEGGYPYARGESLVWCDRLLRGLDGHEFDVYALSRGARQEEAGWCDLPRNVARVRTAPLWGDGPAGEDPTTGAAPLSYGRRERRRFAEHFRDLAETVCAADTEEGSEGAWPGAREGRTTEQADRFATGLYGLAELASERGGLSPALRSEQAVRILESACRAPGALRAVQSAQVSDLLAVTERLERALRPLSLDWYGERGGDPGLASADLCHAVGGGLAALPGLLAQRTFGTPLLISEYGVRLREHYLASAAGAVAPVAAGAPVRAMLASFQGRLAREAYARAQLITPGNTHARRWQERCGARPEKLRTVYPGMDASPFAEIGEQTVRARPSDTGRDRAPTLVWVGSVEPEKDLLGLLHAFAQVRERVPGARLRVVARGEAEAEDADYGTRCRALAAQLFPDEASDARSVGECPVSFEELGGPTAPSLAEAYGAGDVVVLSSVVEGFPVSLVEAMFCGRATVSTDVGAVCEVIGGTGLVVPPRNPRALADACADLLRDPARGARLGAAARSRALELFTVEQNVEAFRGIYLELMSHCPVPGASGSGAGQPGTEGAPHPFARPAEAHLPGRWAATGARRTAASDLSSASASASASISAPASAAVPTPSWATGADGAGGGSKVSGASGASGASGVSAASGASGAGGGGDTGRGAGGGSAPVGVGADAGEGEAG
ncbi:glycosyltransferase [Streptomyces albiaxialis]|uniref:D-inositol 3-phosphate glycosyltransferase n=1 Tax=Streptomyces albiaxialis TaxID=329523 RepID=A0ABP5HG10_9ACTN